MPPHRSKLGLPSPPGYELLGSVEHRQRRESSTSSEVNCCGTDSPERSVKSPHLAAHRSDVERSNSGGSARRAGPGQDTLQRQHNEKQAV